MRVGVTGGTVNCCLHISSLGPVKHAGWRKSVPLQSGRYGAVVGREKFWESTGMGFTLAGRPSMSNGTLKLGGFTTGSPLAPGMLCCRMLFSG